MRYLLADAWFIGGGTPFLRENNSAVMLLLEENKEKEIRCPQCGKVVTYGRVDRRFCSVSCKNLWHNRQRYPNKDKEVKRVLRILDNNREVLDKLIKMDMRSVDRTTLLHLGYNTNYFTSLQKLRHRWVYTCLDIRYELTPTRIKHIAYLWEGGDSAKSEKNDY